MNPGLQYLLSPALAIEHNPGSKYFVFINMFLLWFIYLFIAWRNPQKHDVQKWPWCLADLHMEARLVSSAQACMLVFQLLLFSIIYKMWNYPILQSFTHNLSSKHNSAFFHFGPFFPSFWLFLEFSLSHISHASLNSQTKSSSTTKHPNHAEA